MTWTPQTQCFVLLLFFLNSKTVFVARSKKTFLLRATIPSYFFKPVSLTSEVTVSDSHPFSQQKQILPHFYLWCDVVKNTQPVCYNQLGGSASQPFHRFTRKGESMEERLCRDTQVWGVMCFLSLHGKKQSRCYICYVKMLLLWGEWKQITVVFFKS